MKTIDEIERLLDQMRVPFLMEGPHRERLREQLLTEPVPCLPKARKMGVPVRARRSVGLKAAAALMAVAMLVGAGWAAEKIYERLKLTQATLILENDPPEQWTLADGRRFTSGGMVGADVNPDDPQAAETARRHHEELKQLIAQQQYQFLSTFENAATGETEYVYRFTYSDGKQSASNFSLPLAEVDSWEDYLWKSRAQKQRYHEQVNKAIATGRYRLLSQEPILQHICRETASQEKFRVQRIPLSDGEELAHYLPFDLTEIKPGSTQPQSSWAEHLQAIRDGKLELLGTETMPFYKYEVIFEDGTKRFFTYGGGDPLK